MASRLQDRLDFALVYTTEGEEELGAVSDRLSELNARGTNVNEITNRSREIMTQKAAADREAAAATQEVTRAQFDMATAVSDANEIVRDATIGAELLKFEFEQGLISQEDYAAGLDELGQRLQGVEVHTMSSIRAMRSLANEQRNVSTETTQATGNIRQNVFAMNRLSRTVSAVPRGLNAITSQIPFLAGSFGRLSASGDQTTSVLARMTQFIASPVGLTIAIGALIPLVLELARRFDILNRSTIDVDEAGKEYAKTLRDITQEVLTLQGLTDRGILDLRALEDEQQVNILINQELEERIELLQQQMESAEHISGLNVEEAELINRNRERKQQIQVLEEAIEQTKERQKEIDQEIFTINQLRESQVLNLLLIERGRRQAAEFMLEFEERMVQEMLERRLEAEERVTEAIRRQMELVQQRRQQQMQFMQLLEATPPPQGIGDDGDEIQRALTRQQLAEDARMAVMRDSITQRQFVQMQMERQFQQERLDLIRQGITDEESLKNLRVLQDQELQDALLQLEQESLERKTQLWQDFAGAIQGFGSVIHGQSEENAKKAFELDKALALASATAFGAQAVVRAFARGGFAEAIPVGAAVVAQIAKIAATQFKSRGAGSGRTERITHEFRGAQPQTVPGVQTQVKLPNTLRLTDNAGRFLTNLEYERDKTEDQPYLVRER